ncbi:MULTISPECIES: hypothetical protein [Virgibacillus]|uniref:hypothetical protein n=1 Tax=Virgibacillus TaxID=84406 RepID=UPI0013CEF119|nr:MULTISPECIES: hypothetical protein [Virgibacillus]WBX79772.1 hypothetical protein PD280_19320 [Virgibacillus salarius]
MKLQSVGVFIPHRLLVPQGYDLKAFEPIGHLLAVDPPLIHIGFALLLKLGSYCQLYAG